MFTEWALDVDDISPTPATVPIIRMRITDNFKCPQTFANGGKYLRSSSESLR